MNEPTYRLPTVEEILAGQSQGGVPRPAVSIDDIVRRPDPASPRVMLAGCWEAVSARLRAIFSKGA